MSVDLAISAARASGRHYAETLADEVERLRAELVKANAEQERLENQLHSVRSELVAATVKLDEWERVQVVAADIAQMLSDNNIIPMRGIDPAEYIRDLPPYPTS